MPRQARLDLPGQIYHVLARGIERGRICIDDYDYADLAERFRSWLQNSGGKCLAWCLMPNHFHFVILRGDRPLSELMHHMMTGYAVSYNNRHQRAGHLFQNRYKAILCDAQEYLVELVLYIHLNPLRAKLVKDLAALERYKWCGHGSLAAGALDGILDRDAVLAYFGDDGNFALNKYMTLMAERAAGDARKFLPHIGRPRKLEEKDDTLAAVAFKEKAVPDARILGNESFVEAVLKAAGRKEGENLKNRAELLAEVEKRTGVPREDILAPSHEREPARARAIYCYLSKEKAGACGSELMRELKISQSGISRLIAKGRKLARELVI
ncbi:MAG: hypothetical protein A3J79_14425 [Elusimicrobia bacterium RIFOXYB2_FULL_62_6]|nr:MAG: hypothetical protein A3J79_14425 [Elusimicrobia bacterium RIFOXYB2_FULL_62_6]